MRDSHILLVTLKVFYKKCNLKTLKKWWLKQKIIEVGSVDQAIEGRHYSRAVRLHKQSLESLLSYKYEKEFMYYLPTLWKILKAAFPFHITIQNVISMPEIQLCKNNY